MHKIIKKVFKITGVILYVMAGFVIVSICSMAFLILPPEIMKWKLVLLGIPAVLAVLIMIAGAALHRFRRWKTAVGAVLISGTCAVIFAIITFVSMRLDPNYNKLFNQQIFKEQMLRQQMAERNNIPPDVFNSIPSNPFDMFSDYTTGFGTLLILLILGIFLVISEKRKLDNKEAACE